MEIFNLILMAYQDYGVGDGIMIKAYEIRQNNTEIF